MNKYVPGETVRIRATFKNELGAKTNPVNVTVDYKFVDQNQETVGAAVSLVYGVDGAVARPSTGEFHVDVPTSLSLAKTECKYRFASTDFSTAEEGEFQLLDSPFATDPPAPLDPGSGVGGFFQVLRHTVTQAELDAGTPINVACSFAPTGGTAMVSGGGPVGDLVTFDGLHYYATLNLSDGSNPSPFQANNVVLIFAVG